MKILITLLLMTLSVNAQKLGPWGWMLQTNSVFKNASNSFLGNINMNGQIVSNGNTMAITQYFAVDLPGNTNGPMVNYRTPGVGGISNLWTEIVLGTVSRGLFVWSQTAGDGGAYGGFYMNTDHNGSPPAPNNAELQISAGANIFFGTGAANPFSGHIQFGPLNTPYCGYGGANCFFNFQSPVGTLTQTAPTNFSPALVFNTGMLQGANGVNFYPGILSYGIRTNAPGRVALMFTGAYGGAADQSWDANSAKNARVFEITMGDLTNAIFYKPINYPTNLGTVAIDCSIPVSDQTVAGGGTTTFTSPVNFDSLAKQYEHIYMFITNSGASTTLAPPANARLAGTLTLTRQVQVEWWIKIGKYTNGVVTQWF